MSKIFIQPKWKNAMCVLWIITVLGVLRAYSRQHIHDSVPSKCDKDKLDVCQISKEFNHPSTRCLFTSIVECERSIYAGPGSLCKIGLSLASTFECKSGIWTSTGTGKISNHGERNVMDGFAAWWKSISESISDHIFPIFVSRSGSQTIPPSIKDCPESLNIPADSGKATASVSWNEPTVEEGIELRMEKGKEPNSTFNEGETEITYKALDPKTSLTATCIFYVTVTVHYCSPSVTYHEHRNYECTNERPVQGSSCNFTCEDGYNLIGNSVVTCNGPQGTWSSAFPVCTARSCDDPGKVEGGIYLCRDGWMYPNMCFIICNKGYQNTGVQSIKCKADGVWSQSSPCIDVESPKFPNGCPVDMELFSGPLESPVKVTWDTPEVTDNSGLSVNLRSDPSNGSLISPGTRIIKFTATDVEQNSASCSFVVTIKVRSCSPLSIPSNGRVTCDSGYVEGSVCTVTCSQGYTLEGNASLTCTERMQWSVDMPVCEVIMCPSQPIVNYGVITCGSGRQYLSACTLSCHPGFKAVNPLFIECLSNGSWTLPGECIDVEPPTFVNGCPNNLEVSASRLGLNTTAIWSQPIVTDNSGGIINITSNIHNGSVFPPGVTFVTYRAVDGSRNSRSCHFSVTVTTLRCATPDLELPNRTRTLMMYDCPNGYVYGATCSLSCSHGFPLVGVKYIMCEIHENTAPPSMYWNWTAPSAEKPECRVANCSKLAPPQNGALSCFLGNFGWDCLMICNSAWDVPMATDGHFYCTDSIGFWTPGRVPDCIVRVLPEHVRLQSDMFYYTGSCNVSIDDLRQNFITRMNNSTWRDACPKVPLCNAENVQVTCGLMRRKRSDENSRLRNVRDAVLYVAVKFDIVISYEENGRSSQDVYQEIQSTRDSIFQKLQTEYEAGYFDEPGLQISEFGFGYLTLRADCPPGTAFIETVDTQIVSCKGCGKGHYLAPESDVCEVCPVGTYSELENATTCTPCTSGWSTYSSASQSTSDCKELCAEGTMSKDGFLPCQVCPLGQYQPAVGSITCHSCAAGTWTLKPGSKGIDQCISVDVHLKNTSLSLIVKESWSELTVGGWILLMNKSSASLTFDFGSDGEVFKLDVFSEDIVSSDSGISNTSYTTAVINIISGSWSRLFLTLNSQTGNTSVYHNGIPVLSFHQSSFSAMTPGQILISAPSGTVVVSGFHAKDHIVSEEYTNESSQTCIDPSHNILSWTPSPSTLDTPSMCDPVDECLLRPCGDHPCENLLGGFVCHCQDGWTGETCNVSPNTCETNYCLHGSECVATSDSYTCRCIFGYTGTHCELEVERVLPERVRLQYEMFYYTGSCNVSIDDLRQNFITRMNNSTWKDACPNVRLCTAEIVQVKYDRSNEKSRLRNVGDAVLYASVKFDIVMSYEENGRSPQDVYQELQSTKENISQKLKEDNEAEYFGISCLPETEFGYEYPTLRADCPPGTAFIEVVETKIFFCRGCGMGHYLAPESDVCEVCPVGTYSELENATTCTPCTSGWSTYSSASQSASDCKELCVAGTVSKDGFGPCQVCPLGQYQPAVGSMTCLSCAAGTWTMRPGSKRIDHCIFVDAHLQNTSISLTVRESWSALTVTGWILLTENSSASLTFDFGSDGEVFELDVFSKDIVSSDSSVNNTLSTSAVINIISGSFSRLLLTFSSQTGNASLYHNDILVSSFHQSSFSASTPGQILIHALSGKVVVSGFNAKDQIASQEDINESSATCVDPAHNILSWTPSPSTLYTPSMCDRPYTPPQASTRS